MSLSDGFNPVLDEMLSDRQALEEQVGPLKEDAREFEKNDDLEAAADCRREIASRLEEAAKETNDIELKEECRKAAREHRKRARYLDPTIDLQHVNESRLGSNESDADSDIAGTDDPELVDVEGLWITPDSGFEELRGMDDEISEIENRFLRFIEEPEKFDKYYYEIPKGLVLSGPSGTGKSTLAKSLAFELSQRLSKEHGEDQAEEYSCLDVKCPNVKDSLLGNSAKNLQKIFKVAKNQQPAMILFDELDALFPARSDIDGSSGGQGHIDITNTMLSEVSDLEGEEVFCVGTTNRLGALDSALMKPHRFEPMEIGTPDAGDRREIFELYLEKSVVDDGSIDLDPIVENTEGFTGAEIESVVQRAGYLAAIAEIEGGMMPGICQSNLEDAVIYVWEKKIQAEEGKNWV